MTIKNSLGYSLMQISVVYRNSLQRAMNEIGLHSGQIFILISLWNNDGQSQIDLVKDLKLTAPTINKMIGSLQRNEFIESRRCETDGRVVRIFLTDKGREAEGLAEKQWAALESGYFAVLTETEKLILQQILEKLKANTGVAPTALDL